MCHFLQVIRGIHLRERERKIIDTDDGQKSIIRVKRWKFEWELHQRKHIQTNYKRNEASLSSDKNEGEGDVRVN